MLTRSSRLLLLAIVTACGVDATESSPVPPDPAPPPAGPPPITPPATAPRRPPPGMYVLESLNNTPLPARVYNPPVHVSVSLHADTLLLDSLGSFTTREAVRSTLFFGGGSTSTWSYVVRNGVWSGSVDSLVFTVELPSDSVGTVRGHATVTNGVWRLRFDKWPEGACIWVYAPQPSQSLAPALPREAPSRARRAARPSRNESVAAPHS